MTNVIPRRIILGPGPSSAHPRVLRAMSNPVMGYLDPDFFEILDEVSQMLSALYKTEHYSFVIAGTGSAGMEAGLVNLAEGDDEVLICNNGFFCRRMTLMADRLGVNYSSLDFEWGTAVDLNVLEDKLKKSSTKLVAVIHAETSTGVLNPIDEIGKLCKQYGAMLMVDCVTSLGGIEIKFDEWGIDFAYSGTQKCLAAPPGLSPVALSQRALEFIKSRKTPPSSWYLDLACLVDYWSKDHIAHQTTPVNLIYALREALYLTQEEGIENKINRHTIMSDGLKSGLSALGLELPINQSIALNQLTVVNIPHGIDDQKFRNDLLNDYLIEIGKGLGEFTGKVWRIGLMGESCVAANVFALLNAFEKLLMKYNFEVEAGLSLSSASSIINSANLKPY